MTQPSLGAIAPTSRRAVAYIIDALIAGALGVVLTIVLVASALSAGPDMLSVFALGAPLVSLVMFAWMVVYTFMQSSGGSIGMRAQGLRLVGESDGAPLGFWMTLLRNIIFGLAATIIVGYFTPLFDGTGRFQGWHDKVAKSLMLDARADAAAGIVAPAGNVAPAGTTSMAIPPRPSLPSQMPAPTFAAPAPIDAAPADAAPAPADAAPALADASPAPAAPEAAVIPPRPPMPVRPAAQDPAQAPESADDLIAFVPGITQDSAVDPQEPADLEDTRISVPGHRLVFTWDDGTRVSVSRRTLFGRNPSPEDGAVVVPVRDETLSLSKTHFEAVAEVSGGWITDRHSTNGTVLVRDGQRILCAPGERVRVRLGDAVEIGDRIVTIGGYA